MKNPFYVIVRFELKEREIDVLFLIIQKFFKTEVSTVSGFISAKFLRNEDGSVLINYPTIWCSFATSTYVIIKTKSSVCNAANLY